MGLVFVNSRKSCRYKESLYGNKVNIFYLEIVRNNQMCFLDFGKTYFKKIQRKVHHASSVRLLRSKNSDEQLEAMRV